MVSGDPPAPTSQAPPIAAQAAPFSKVERMIAWRYLRAKRAEGGISVMTWISLIGITLAVFALIATLAVRAGFRAEFVDTILGANAHATLYPSGQFGGPQTGFEDYETLSARIAALPGVINASPVVRGQLLVSYQSRTAGAEVYGISEAAFRAIPRISGGEAHSGETGVDGASGATLSETNIGIDQAHGDINRYQQGIAMGKVLARDLGVSVGSRVRLISPNGPQTLFGTAPRVNAYEVVYIFSAGRYDIDKTRIYMPFIEAQSYFNREGVADEIQIITPNPEEIDSLIPSLLDAAPRAIIWTWRDNAGSFLRALDIEDNIMFIILSILVLIASMNIASGLIMLVKNKGRDIGILRTMGFSEGAVLRIFFLCGAFTGIIGTLSGVVLGCLFALYIDPIFSAVNAFAGGGVWDPSIRNIYALPAKLLWGDVASAVALSLGLSFVVTIFPARRAARMNPVEALRHE